MEISDDPMDYLPYVSSRVVKFQKNSSKRINHMDLISNLMVKPLVYYPRKKIWFEGPMDFFNIDLDQMSNSCSEQSEAFVNFSNCLKFSYSEKATKFCEISTVDLS